MGKSKPTQEITEYRMSIHFGICAGPIDYMRRIYVGEKIVLEGFFYSAQDMAINLPRFFGGPKKEGGLQGSAMYLPGGSDQLMPARICTKYGLTQDEMPAYRGMATMYFIENSGARRPGFLWGTTPYLRSVWISVARASLGLPAIEARIFRNIVDTATEPGLDLATDVTSSGFYRGVDTNGDWAVRSSSGTPQDYDIWDLRDGSHRHFVAAGYSVIGTTCLITDDDELMIRTGGSIFSGPSTIEFLDLNDPDLAVKQTIPLAPVFTGLNSSIENDEILMPTGDRFMFNWVFPGSNVFLLLKKTAGQEFWAIEYSEPQSMSGLEHNEGGLVMGTEYAYIYNSTTSNIGTIRWNADLGTLFERTLVTPPGLSPRALQYITYLVDSDEVAVICTNGDLVIYDAAITTLKRQANIISTPYLGISKRGLPRRSSIGYGRIAIPRNTNTFGVVTAWLIVDTQGFQTSTILVNGASNFVNQSIAMIGSAVNERHGGVFMGPNGSRQWMAFWPLTPVGDFDSNPAHIIYEALTNTSWGMGAPEDVIDYDSFLYASSVLYAENFGISMPWIQQTTVEDFVQDKLDHIEANLFLSPRTGLLTLKLIRDDYDADTLPIYNEHNSVVTSFKRKVWGETINEIVVTWTDPDNEEEMAITVQDGGNIAIQGKIISDGRNYHGIRTAALATTTGYRDLRVASAPLATCDIEVDRNGWDFLPGDVIKISSPEDDVVSMVMRIGPIDYGRPGSPQIKASLVEDVFALPLSDYSIAPETEWVDPTEDPAPAVAQYAFTMPRYMALNELNPIVAAQPNEYPTVFGAMLAAAAGFDTDTFMLWGTRIDGLGDPYEDSLGEKSIISRAEIDVALVPEAVSTVSFLLVRTDGDVPVPGGLVIIGDGAETEVEIGQVTALSTTVVTIRRGVLDTVPRNWPIGTPIWYLNGTQDNADNVPRSAFEVVEYRARTITSGGILAIASAPLETFTLTERPHLPNRPANVTVNGVDFSAIVLDLEGVNPIPITVAERNRLTEDAIVLAWDDATVTPEVGQTWQIVVMSVVRTVITTITGLTGTTYNLDPASLGGASTAILRFEAERDGLVSLQAYEITIKVLDGYGYGYGYNYGGA